MNSEQFSLFYEILSQAVQQFAYVSISVYWTSQGRNTQASHKLETKRTAYQIPTGVLARQFLHRFTDTLNIKVNWITVLFRIKMMCILTQTHEHLSYNYWPKCRRISSLLNR
jgi:hypothetical protein